MSGSSCLNCNNFKVYNTRASLSKHLKEVHGTFDLRIQSYPIDTFDYKCLEGCLISFMDAKDLRQHLVQKHAILMDQAIFEFENQEDFSNWMTNLNGNPKQQYTINDEQHQNGHLKIKNYGCVYSETCVQDRKRKVNDLHTLCTSEIIVIENLRTKLIVVTCFKTHYGHPKNTEYIKCPSNYVTRRIVKLTSKMPERLVNGPDQTTAKSRSLNGVGKNKIKHFAHKKKCDKSSLKKDIICLLQDLSGNDFDKYDINTLKNVKETLSDCCGFLNSYEMPEKPTTVQRDVPILESSPYPPSLLWFSEKDIDV